MKNSNEWVRDIQIKLNQKKQRSKRNRKIAIGIISGCVCVAFVLTAVMNLLPIINQQLDLDSSSNIADNRNGVVIPEIKLPNKSNNQMMDMIGLVVYKGKIYTQGEIIDCDSQTKKALLKDYVGKALGNIDEWSKKSEYDKELAGTTSGDVYTVNGYDESFMLAIPREYDGKEQIEFFYQLNGITLETGIDLYENRLHLKEQYNKVTYQLHDDWNNAQYHFKDIDLSKEEIDLFIEELYAAPFVDLYDKNSSDSIYDKDLKRAHLYFELNDKTVVALDLLENGYVRFEPMHGRYFVKLDSDNYKKVFEACMK